MKFLPTFNINAPGIYEAVRSGRLKLQPGQWVRVDNDPRTKASRFVSASAGYLNIVHPDGPFATGTVKMGIFRRRVEKIK